MSNVGEGSRTWCWSALTSTENKAAEKKPFLKKKKCFVEKGGVRGVVHTRPSVPGCQGGGRRKRKDLKLLFRSAVMRDKQTWLEEPVCFWGGGDWVEARGVEYSTGWCGGCRTRKAGVDFERRS